LSQENLVPICAPIIITSGNFDHILNISKAKQNIRGRHGIVLLTDESKTLMAVSPLFEKQRIREDVKIQLIKKGKV